MKIDKKEVLRYLRYNSNIIDKFTDKIIDECIEEIQRKSKPNFTFKIFNFEKKFGKIFIEGTTLELEGNNIYEHLYHSEKCAIMAVTLGIEVDRMTKYYSKVNMTKSLILDACATAAIESFCDEVEGAIKEVAISQGYNITSRYSPGYGDFSIEIQPHILRTLNSQVQIGVTVTDSLILIPRKSVTAIIGLCKNKVISKPLKCVGCNHLDSCMYAKRGKLCENK